MTQFAKLSAEAQNIVNDFSSIMHSNGFPNNPTMMLGTSLYALQSDADKSVTENLNNYIVNLNSFLTSEQIAILQSEYTNVILACFGYESDYFTQDREMQMTPTSIVDLCLQLAQCKSGSNVYLPYNGMGEFSHKLKGCKCIGFEINPVSWAVSEIVNSVSGVDCNVICSDQDVKDQTKRFDYIFTCLPFSRNKKNTVSELIHLITNNLETDGEMYAVALTHICFAEGNIGYDFRAKAQDLNASITVMMLPNSIFDYTHVNICLIHVKNDVKGKVTLADFSGDNYLLRNYVSGKKRYSLNIENITDNLNRDEGKSVWRGTYTELKEDLSFIPGRYLPFDNIPELSEGERLIRLGDLIDRLPNTRLSVKSFIPLIGNRELSDNYLNCNVSAQDPFESKQETTSVIDRDCLLIGSIGGKIKVAKLTDASYRHTVTMRADVFPVRLKSDIITEDYLLRSLLNEFSAEQVERYSTGSVIKRITFRDLCDILIKVPSLEDQKMACYNDAHEGVRYADKKLQQAYEDYRRDVHMKKHAIGQTLAAFKNWWKLLDIVRKSSEGVIKEDTVIGRIHKTSVKDILDNIDSSFSKLCTQINSFDKGYGLIKEDIALTEFIEKYIRDNKSPLFEYDYNPRDHRSMDDIPEVTVNEDLSGAYLTGEYSIRHGEPLEYVKFPKEALTTIFNDIVSNACAHGFAGRKDRQNIIRIDIDSVGTDYIVTISNNGEPLDPAMKSDEITVYGHTSGDTRTHYGIGGYEVKRLMEEFGGNVEIVSHPDEEFTVSYRLIFHDTNILFAL